MSAAPPAASRTRYHYSHTPTNGAMGDPAVDVKMTMLAGDGEDEDTKPPRPTTSKGRSRRNDDSGDGAKRRCVSTACLACRRRKSKCDGGSPACAACSVLYFTECVYDPNSDHRRKGVYKKDIDNLKTRNSTLQTLVQAILTFPEEEVPPLIKQIRGAGSLDDVAQSVRARQEGVGKDMHGISTLDRDTRNTTPFEKQLSGHMGRLRLEDDSVRYIGGTSHLLHVSPGEEEQGFEAISNMGVHQQHDNPITSWMTVTSDPDLITHLLNMYFTWHYPFSVPLSKALFYRDFLMGKPAPDAPRAMSYCSPVLVNAMLAMGCHFTSVPGAREDPIDSATVGEHFFKEAKRLLFLNEEHEKPRLTTVQALMLMSSREAGCGREVTGWVYSGMSFRMAGDLGLTLDSGGMSANKDVKIDEDREDARRVTFWGCYLFDKCWSNYLGRLPQLQIANIAAPKYEVFPVEDAETWRPYTDSGFGQTHAQPSRTRAVALRISALCEISDDLMSTFYNPSKRDGPYSKQAELRNLCDIHAKLETWKKDLPKEMEAREGALPSVLSMHMFYQLLHIHLFRPFLRYTANTSPLPTHLSPRKLCTQAAAMISKLLRLYKRSYGLRQTSNIVVYITHCACTIHLLNLPEKNARRDIIQGLKNLEEMAEGWLSARRTLCILSLLAKRWKVELPEEAGTVLARTDAKFAAFAPDSQTPRTQSPRTALQQNGNGAAAPPAAPVHPGDFTAHDYNKSNTTISNAPGLPPLTTPTLTSRHPLSLAGRDYHRRLSEHQFAQSLPRHLWSFAPDPGNTSPPRSHPAPGPPLPLPLPQTTTTSSTSTSTASLSSNPDPSAIQFSNVDALLRNSTAGSAAEAAAPPLITPQDWWYGDQSQLATGFENWGLSDAEAGYLGFMGSASVAGAAPGTVAMEGVERSGGGTTAVATEPMVKFESETVDGLWNTGVGDGGVGRAGGGGGMGRVMGGGMGGVGQGREVRDGDVGETQGSRASKQSDRRSWVWD